MSSSTEPAASAHRNDVVIVGRLAAPAEERLLPSGDRLMTWRLVVERASTTERGPRVDALDCSTRHGGVQRRSNSWQAGDTIEVHGSLRRRFWRGQAGLASRCEIDVTEARRVGRGKAP
jgi:single-strand DNA-binding protein